MALLWDLHPPIWIRQGSRLSQHRPSDGAAMSTALASTTGSLKAVTWFSQHPTASHPSGGVMVDRGEPRPQTQSHGPGGPSCKSGHSFRIKFGRFAIAEHFLQLAKWSSTAHLPTCPPLQAQHWQSVPQHLLTQTGAGREGWKDHPCFKSFGLRHRMSAAEGGPSSSRDALGLLPPYHSRLLPARQGALSQRAGCELNSKPPSEASPLLSWWCKTCDDPS